MTPAVVEKLVAINRRFYAEYAQQFSLTRNYAWKGFERLANLLPQPCTRFLDVGCGDGRLGRYMLENEHIENYVGVDFSAEMLETATNRTPNVVFHQRNFVEPDSLADLGQFEAVVCLATMHHIPRFDHRVTFLRGMAERLAPHGKLVLINWQFLESERLRRKVCDWSEVDLSQADVEENDYLLNWQLGGYAYRYVTLIDEASTEKLMAETDLRLLEQFRSDGKEGNLNLYTVFGRK